ncbi:MAG: DsbA family protein [bacterium]
MKNPQMVFLIIIIAVGLVFGGYLLNPGATDTTNPVADETPAAISDPALINNDQAPLIGSADAKVKLVVFSDYLCSYCKSAHEVMDGILKDNPDVSLQARSFILQEDSRIFAQAAEAANKQGKFAEMNNALFNGEAQSNEDSVKVLASKLGLDVDQFVQDLNSDEIKSRVAKDEEDALGLGLQGTPSIYLNNSPVSNFKDLPSLVEQQK